MPKNVIQHFEWTTRDADRLKAFFGEIFDWKFSQPMPDYTLIEGVGGIFPTHDENIPVGVTPYVTVADLDETEAKISAAGGVVFKSRQEVPGMGWFTLFGDPDGNMMAIWQSAPRPKPAPKPVAKKASKPKPKKKKKN